MSRVTTPSTTQPSSPQLKVAHEKIAMRAYEKWVKKGRPEGTSQADWMEAETELKAELSRGTASPAPANQRR